MSNPLRVLIVEDSVEDTFFVVRELQRGGFNVTFERVDSAATLQGALENGCWDLVISDYSMPQFSGEDALSIFQHHELDIPFIMVSGAMGEELAVQMLKAGAHNYVLKERLDRLTPAVKQELQSAQDRRLQRQQQAVRSYLASIVENCGDAIIGTTLDGTVVTWNAGAEKLYGYTAIEMVGSPVSRLVPGYRPEELREWLERVQQGKQVEQLNTIRIRKNGTPVEVSVLISPIRDAQGAIIGASSVSRDISRRNREDDEKLALIQELTAALAQERG